LKILECPSCNSENVAWILWGYPDCMDKIKQELEDGKIILGGCLVNDHDPEWECNDCHHRFQSNEIKKKLGE